MNRLRARSWAFILLIVLVMAACLRLGVWQLDRLGQRRAEIDRIRGQQELPPVRLNKLEITPSLAYRRANVEGEFDPQGQILLENQSLDGQAGYHLITPLRIAQSESGILVDRGWIPFETGISADLDEFESAGMITVAGILMPSVDQPGVGFLADPVSDSGGTPLGSWRFLTIELIQRQVDFPLVPLILVQSEPPPTGSGLPQPDPRLELDEGPHLGYAIQWFAFATIALIGGGLWVRRNYLDTRSEDRKT